MKTKKIKNENKKNYIPSSFLTIITLMILFIIISWIGQAISESINGVGILDVFSSIWHGFVSKSEVILFIFSVGGMLGIMSKVKAIDAGIDALVLKLGNKIVLLIPVLMIIFGLGGTTYGMWEETMAFIPILIPVFKKSGYGPFTAMLIILIGAGTGCLASTINPFSIGTAVSAINKNNTGIISIGTFGGSRWLSFIIFEAVGITLVMWQASRYKNKKNIVTGLENKIIDERFPIVDQIKFTTKRKISLSIFVFTFLLMIMFYLPWSNWISGLGTKDSFYIKYMWWLSSIGGSGFAPLGSWYFVSVASLFLMASLIVFVINLNDFKTEDDNCEEGFINTYMSGVKDMISVCLLIATAAGLGIILKESHIGSWIANTISGIKMGMVTFGIVTFLLSFVLSLLVPSTAGFASVFMPIFASIAIKSGLNIPGIAISMMSFIFASGLANFITPTSAALMGYTKYAGIPYGVWIKQTWKIVVVYAILAFILIIIFSALANGGNLF